MLRHAAISGDPAPLEAWLTSDAAQAQAQAQAQADADADAPATAPSPPRRPLRRP